LSQSNFFIGINNSGKSAILKALHCFFNSTEYYPDFINKTEFRSKGSGYNKSIIGVTFDLNFVNSKKLQADLKQQYGNQLVLYKNFTLRETTNIISIDYTLDNTNYTPDALSPLINEFLKKISVSYIHPQEAKNLLEKAQEKLKSRLLSNWGRNANLAETLKGLQKQWTELRIKANNYLSNGLTQSLQNIWPGCQTIVDLPEKIDDIIGISEILFKQTTDLPEVSLTSQGTGAQSTILYQTHFLLDSDRTLHRGFYYPIWLIEEPESFLHADIIFKLGYLLCSDLWLNNIQMLISTHSPLLLATSKQNGTRIKWFSIYNYLIINSKMVSDWDDEEIREVGILMGDSNFEIYFKSSAFKKIVVIEDTREVTKDKLIDAGIEVSFRLNGVTELKRYFDVLRSIDISMGRNIYFLIDNDDGYKEFRSTIENGEEVSQTRNGFIKYKFQNNVFLIVFPNGYAIEELFNEYDLFLESCANQLYSADYKHAATDKSIPPNLTRAHAFIRNKSVNNLGEAKNLIRNHQDVKDTFWNKVERENLSIDRSLARELDSLIL
jgi:hypothetical protein